MSDLGIEVYNSSNKIQLDSDYFTLYLNNIVTINPENQAYDDWGNTLNTDGVFAIRPDLDQWCTWLSVANGSMGTGKLYNFSTEPTSDKSNYGLEVYDASSKTIFSSDFKSIKVIDEIEVSHSATSSDFWSKKYSTTNIAVIPKSINRAVTTNMVGMNRYATSVKTYAFKLDSDGTLHAGVREIFFAVGATGGSSFGDRICKFLVIDISGF